MTAEHLARRLTEAAARTATRRAALSRAAGAAPAPTVDEPTPTVFVPVDPGELLTGWWAYGQAIWPLGDDITDDRIVVEGADRRSYGALNHYLRGSDHPTAADRALPRDIPTITEGRVSFERAGDTVRVTTDPGPVTTETAVVAALIATPMSTTMSSSSTTSDATFWARYFPVPAPGDDTVYWDSCRPGHDPGLPGWQQQDRAGRAWFWVVWRRGRPAVHGWTEDAPNAAAAAAATTTDRLTHHPGPAAAYLGSWVSD